MLGQTKSRPNHTSKTCLYKKYTDNNVPKHVSLMFANINSNEYQNSVISAKYKTTVRFTLPAYIQTAPTELMNKSQDVSYFSFKAFAKNYIIDRYSSLCTVTGCVSCHLHLRI